MVLSTVEVILVCAMILAEMAWAGWLWMMWRQREAECRKAEARLAMASNHICRLYSACDALLGLGDFATNSCCCGDDMGRHSDPMSSGHVPVDQGEYHARRVAEGAMGPARAWLEMRYSRWHHPKRGTTHHVLAEGIRHNMSTPIRDGDEVVLYQDVASGTLSTRRAGEFLDGRFVLQEPGT